jgi:putative protease
VVFDAADWRSPEEPEEGGRIYQVAKTRDGRVELRFGNNEVRFDRIRAGDRVWRTHDPDLDRAARPFLHPAAPVAKQPVNVRVIAKEGRPLIAEWSIAKRPEIEVEVKTEEPLGRAQNRGVAVESLREQFGRLGNTPYQLAGLTLEMDGSPFVSASVLNQLRRDAVEQLQKLQGEIHPPKIIAPKIEDLRPSQIEVEALPASLHLLVRTPEQLDAALTLCGAASITLDYLDLYGLRPSVERVKSSRHRRRASPARAS